MHISRFTAAKLGTADRTPRASGEPGAADHRSRATARAIRTAASKTVAPSLSSQKWVAVATTAQVTAARVRSFRDVNRSFHLATYSWFVGQPLSNSPWGCALEWLIRAPCVPLHLTIFKRRFGVRRGLRQGRA